MKFIFTLCFINLCIGTSAQRVTVDKVDEFTKNRIKKTSWELLYRQSGITHGSNVFYRVSKIDSVRLLSLKIMLTSNVFSINDGDELMIKLANDSIVTLKNNSFTISSIGGGANGYYGSALQGLEAMYEIGEDEYSKITSIPISKIRMVLSKFNFDMEIKSASAKSFNKSLLLIK